MRQEILPQRLHPSGEQLPVEANAPTGPTTLDTFAGPVRVEWDRSSPLTPLGQFVYFIEFLIVFGRLVLARCRLTACMVALVYNWWNIFVRLAEPDKHLEAITSRSLLLAGIAERTRHGRQTSLRIASTHGRARWAQRVLTDVARFLRGLTNTAEQLTADDRWARILAHADRSWLKGRRLRDPPRLVAPA